MKIVLTFKHPLFHTMCNSIYIDIVIKKICIMKKNGNIFTTIEQYSYINNLQLFGNKRANTIYILVNISVY